MSVSTTQQRARRRAGRALRMRGYQPFAPTPGLDRFGLAREHQAWLLRNMDWFARQGQTSLNAAHLAFHRNLAILADAPMPPPQVEMLPAHAALVKRYEELQAVLDGLYVHKIAASDRLADLALLLGDTYRKNAQVNRCFQEIRYELNKIRYMM